MNEHINFHTLMQYGSVADNVLEICESFSIVAERVGSANCQEVASLSCYHGNECPRIEFSLTAEGQKDPFYTSHSYIIGKEDEYTLQSWRVPPLFLPGMTLRINIDVPNGTTLKLRNFTTDHTASIRDWNGGPRYNAHLGFWGLAPDNTIPAFELAAVCGFPACIVVPKVTRDGILVCIHDDTINRTARDENGNAPPDPIYVWDKNYDELLKWEYGSYKNQIYKGVKIPLLSDFFDLCAKTGMRPMFSTHPGLTVEQWKQVKEMLAARGLLKKFHIKSFDISVLKTAYEVFGTEIDGYTYDVLSWRNNIIDTVLNIGIDANSCRVGIEVRFDDYTEQIAKSICDAGMFASAWDIERRDFSEYERLFSMGVTEFTEDHHCSMGLNY